MNDSITEKSEIKSLSILITYYYGEKYIFNCLESIFLSYERSSKLIPFKIILIIDSVNDADKISTKIRSIYSNHNLDIIINDENLGVAQSRNKGLQYVDTNYYTIIDQDDFVLDNYFAVLESSLSSLNAIHLLNGFIELKKDEIKTKIFYFKPTFNFKSIILKYLIIYTPGLIIFNAHHIKPSNLFPDTSEKFKGCDDWAAYLNLLMKNKISYKYISKPIFTYSLHNFNYSNNKAEMINSSKAVLDYLEYNSIRDNYKYLSYIKFSKNIHEFYYEKDIIHFSKSKLLFKYPRFFLFHYFMSFLNLSRLNRLIFLLIFYIKITGKKIINFYK